MQPAETIIDLPEYRVSEIAGAIKRAVEDNFGHVRVRGEISGFKRHSSGHCYFSLKDEQSVLGAVCWKATAAKFKFAIEDGMEVVCAGRITTYPARSQYQMVVTDIQPAGEGALMALLEKRRQMFIKEGLFDPARKKPLPFMPQTIGVITSPTGAVIRDILHRLTDRFPVHVMLWPVAVQGEGSAQQIADAIRGFNDLSSPPQLLIIARGGGSIEDLWSFNEEVVVRAIAASKIPTISAVGHETDTTLADFAADRRAPTPTAAAEMAVPVRAELMLAINEYASRLGNGALRGVSFAARKLEAAWRGLPRPQQLLEVATQRLDEFSERLPRAQIMSLERKTHNLKLLSGRADARHLLIRLNNLNDRLLPVSERMAGATARLLARKYEQVESWQQRLNAISYTQTLKRGFTIIKDGAGKPLTSARLATAGSDVEIEFHDGTKSARISGKPSKPDPKTSPQQDLF